MTRLVVAWPLGLVLAIACAACTTTNDGDAADAPEASTIPEVCSTLGSRSSCRTNEHLEPRSPAAQEDCKQGIAERACGEARFLLEKCLDEHPLCLDESGTPTNDDAGRCANDRARWQACEADAARGTGP